MLQRIKAYPLPKLNKINKVTVPAGSVPVKAIGLENTVSPDIIHVLVIEPVPITGEEVEHEELELLVLDESSPFDSPEDRLIMYIDSVVWDNGYRLHHVFQIADEDEYVLEEEEPAMPEPPRIENKAFEVEEVVVEEGVFQ